MAADVNPVNDREEFNDHLQKYMQDVYNEINEVDQDVALWETYNKNEETQKAHEGTIERWIHSQMAYGPRDASLHDLHSCPISKLDSEIDKYIKAHSKGDNKNPKAWSKCEDYEIAKDRASLAKDEEQAEIDAIEQIDPDISGTVNTLNALVDQTSDIFNKGLSDSDRQTALTQIEGLLSQLMDAIKDKVKSDVLQKAMKEVATDPNGAHALQELASQVMFYQTEETGLLSGMQSTLTDDSMAWQGTKDKALLDFGSKSPQEMLKMFFTGDHQDQGTMDGVDALTDFFTALQQAIAPMLTTTVDPIMKQFSDAVDKLRNAIEAYLEGHGTLADVKNAMIAAFSIMASIIADFSKQNSDLDRQVSQSSTNFNEVMTATSFSGSLTMSNAQDNEKKFGNLMKIAEGAMFLFFLATGNFAMAMMMLVMMGLEQGGITQKMQDAISKKLGDAAGAGITATLEAVCTAGGAAALEAAAKAILTTVMETVEAMIESTVQSVIDSVAKSAAKAAGDQGEKAAAQVVEDALRETEKVASKKFLDMFFSKSIVQVIKDLVEGKGMQGIQKAFEKVLQEAIENAGQGIQDLAIKAAQENDAEAVSVKEIEQVAEKAASNAIRDTMEVSDTTSSNLATGKKWGISYRTPAAKMAVRFGGSYLSAMGSTQMLDNMIAPNGKKEDLSNNAQITLAVFDSLFQMIGMMLASNGLSVSGGPSAGGVAKFMTLLATVDGAAMAVGQGGSALAKLQESKAIQPMAQNDANIQTMQFVIEELHKHMSAQKNIESQEMQQMGESTQSLALHLTDSEKAQAQAMAVSAV